MLMCFRYKGKETMSSFLYNLTVSFQCGHYHLIHILHLFQEFEASNHSRVSRALSLLRPQSRKRQEKTFPEKAWESI